MAWDTTSSVNGSTSAQGVAGNTATTQGNTSNANTYTPGQQALQGQLPGLYGSLIAGNIPKSFVAPDEVVKNYDNQFNNWTAPQIAVNGGANSPMLAANRAIGESNLLANLYNQGVGNYMSGLNSAESAAFTPTGNTGTSGGASTGIGTNGTNSQFTQNTQQQYAALQNILDLLQQAPSI